VLLFANTSGELPLEPGQQQALLDFVANGGGFVATHSATDTFYNWPAYAELIGATFREHPWSGPATVRVEDDQHPINLGLPASFELSDEYYVFRANPRQRSHILLRLDAASVGAVGDYPLAWCSHYGAGRVYYNALGHPSSTWLDPRFQQQLRAALLWASGGLSGDCRAG
jgi:type 1 glutamine amidotransferase